MTLEGEILDVRGRPLRRRELTREIAAPSAGGPRSAVPTTAAVGVDAARLAGILREAEAPGAGAAERYLELAERMEELDLHYLGVLQTRKRQVAQIGVTVEPASDSAADAADAELVAEFFGRRRLADELYDCLDAVAKGYAVSEIVWDRSERQWMPARLEWRQPQWFDFDPTGRFLRLRADDGILAELAPAKFVVHAPRVKSGLPIRGGLARCAAWSWMFKSLTLRDWARFVEAYGQPIRIGWYPPGASDAEMSALRRAVANIASDAAALLPEGMRVEFAGAESVRGRSEVYRDLVAYIDGKMSVAVLGQTLTTQEGDSGSYALGQVHNLVRADIERSDAEQLAETLERDVARWIVRLNNGPRAAYPRVVIERQAPQDAKLLSDVLAALVPLGLRVREDDVRAKLGFDAPGAEDAVLAAPHPPAAGVAVARARDASDPVAQVVRAIDAGTWETLAEPLVRPVLARAKADPEAFLADVSAAFPEMSADALGERLARALFVADCWERLRGPDG